MPLYEFRCTECGEVVQRLQKHDDPPPLCEHDPEHGPTKRQVSRSSFVLKGTGWARTGYA